ncbi:prolyl oligopeptidase family serine peptidase [Pseudonocardia eucalypti]|uniref:Prolyl oligopeptidase family serine peptidase n=1 Tax=Pseudonocardia eucalypti TaxID=648755 RepID=A0ABP9QMD4_9PSEU|nr:prolyl oligopeptidase [Pseudonocardia eucalypti]
MNSPDPLDDPYLWLEEVTGEEPLTWVRARNAETLADLAVGDRFEELRAQTLEVLDDSDRIPYVRRRGELLYNFWQDAERPRGLWRRTTLDSYRSADTEWEHLLDVDALGAAEGENWVWAGAGVRRPDYARALVELSRGGADAAVVREFDLETKEFVSGGFTLPEAKTRVSWIDADTIYVGTDTGPGSMTTSGYPRVIREWRRGTPVAEAPVVFEAAETDVSAYAWHDHTEGFVRDFVGCRPDFHTSREYLRRPDGRLQLIDVPDDAEADVHREWLLVRPRSPWELGDATHPAGSLLAFRFDDYLAGDRTATVLFSPTPSRSLSYHAWTRHHLILVLLVDVATRVEVLTPDQGWARVTLPGGPDLGSTDVIGVDPDHGDEYLLDVSGYTQPPALLRGEIDGGVETLRQAPAFFETTGMRTRQFFAESDDGTRVPYFVVGAESDRPAPTLMTGYGGFEIPLTPRYSGIVGRGWLARGGNYVVANVRGGGEYGPDWHTAALGEHRERAYQDFAAVARDLARRGITTPARLAVHGGSNGGLLMGVMLTRYPSLFGAIVIQVPLLDMRRYHLLLAGASWMAEYGDPESPRDWEWLARYSPYQNLRRGVVLPPVLVTTSTRDDRVHPGHARKMVARMREYGYPVSYYENIEGGHGGAADNAQRAFQWALLHEFCWRHVGG